MGPFDHKTVQIRIPKLGADVVAAKRNGRLTFQAPPGASERTIGKYDGAYRLMDLNRSWGPWTGCKFDVAPIAGFKPFTMPFLQAMLSDGDSA